MRKLKTMMGFGEVRPVLAVIVLLAALLVLLIPAKGHAQGTTFGWSGPESKPGVDTMTYSNLNLLHPSVSNASVVGGTINSAALTNTPVIWMSGTNQNTGYIGLDYTTLVWVAVSWGGTNLNPRQTNTISTFNRVP